MMRLLGILLGSFIAVAVLIVIVGFPEFAQHGADSGVSVEVESVRLLREPDKPLAELLEQTQKPEAALMPVASLLPDDAFGDTPQLPETLPEVPETDVQPSRNELRWYAFWSPFRSRIAADGFVSQLQRVTGLDYRVVNLKPGVYEVAFAYADDEEIQANLSQISAATGLEVPES